MNTTALRTFRTVAATLSFTRAAELLDYAQSSVSTQIQGLEAELGMPLFSRIGRRVALTEAGQRLLAYSDRLLALEAEVHAGLSQPAAGAGLPPVILRMGAPESIFTHWLPKRLMQFRNEWPTVQLDYWPLADMELYRRVLDGRLDFALLLQPPVNVDTLAVRCINMQPLRVIAAPGHRLAKLQQVCAADLVGETVYLTESGCGYRHLFEQELVKEGHYAFQKLEFSSVAAIKGCVAEGLGVGFLPELAVQSEIANGVLAALPWEKRFEVQLQLVWPRHKWLSPVEERWVAVCADCPAPPEVARVPRN